MSTIQLSGLNSGIDTKTLVQQLVAAESKRLTMYNNKITAQKEKQTAVKELQSKVSSFKSTLYNISDTSKLKAFNAKSADEDIITASASSGASEGNHSIKVKQLATAERWVHGGFTSETSYLEQGNFIYSYDNTERVIKITNSETTLQDLVKQINNDTDNPGVTASLMNYDSGDGKKWHLVLSGKEPGEDHQIKINTSNTEVLAAGTTLKKKSDSTNAALTTKLGDLSAYSGSSVSGSIQVQGTTHSGASVNTTFSVNKYSTVQDLIDGVELAFGDTVAVSFEDGLLKVTDTTSGNSSLTISSLTYSGTGTLSLPTFTQSVDGGSVSASIASLGSGTFTRTQQAQNAMLKVDGYPADVVTPVLDPETGLPTGATTTTEKWISRNSNTIDDVIQGVTLNLHATTLNTTTSAYDSVDVNLTRNTEDLKEKINSMIEAYNTVKMYIDESTKYDTETKTTGVLYSEYSLTSIQSLFKTIFVTNATGFGDSDSFTKAEDIGLKINADGELELDETTFDEAVVEDYQGVLALIGASKTGNVTGTDGAYASFYAASQYTDAGTYDIKWTVSGGNVTSAQIKLSSETTYRDMVISSDKQSISGSSLRDSSGNPLYPEFDLHLNIDTSKIGSSAASVQIKQGFAGNLYESTTSMLKSDTGRFDIAVDSIDDQVSQMEDKIETEQTRLTKYQDRLTAKYARLEKLLAEIQSQMSSVSAMTSSS